MKEKILISRYAEAYIAVARGRIGLERALEDSRDLKNIIRENPEFLEFLASPGITHLEKYDFIDKVMRDNFQEETLHFVRLLFEKGRISLLPDIVDYIRAAYAHEGEVEVLLRAASLHDLDIIKNVEDKLRQKLNQRLKFYLELDGRLLGGMQIIIGNTIIDGSVKRRLEDLREKLENVRV